MKGNNNRFFGPLGLLFLAAFFFLSCGSSAGPDPAHVAAHSAGILGRTEPIRIEFTQPQDSSIELPANAFSLRPAAPGTLSWQNDYTLVFTPQEPLRPNQRYRARVNLPEVPSFSFEFMSAPPLFAIHLDPIRIGPEDEITLSGVLLLDSDADLTRIASVLSSRELGSPRWTHENGTHRFYFEGIQRGQVSRTAELNWNGRALGISERGFTTVMIPGAEHFELLGLNHENGIIEVSFSSPIPAHTDLRGFITLSGRSDVRYTLEGNIIRIYGDNAGGFSPGTELVIQDLEDVHGNRLAIPVQFTVSDRWELPEIRFPGSGTILPSSQGTNLVLETRNVSGVIVEAFHIYGDNMFQFLQINAMSGERELDRVGEPVWSAAIDFPWDPMDQNRWVRRGLDLSELSRAHPGGMFRIRVSFRPRHVHYECTVGHGDFSNREFPDDTLPPYFTAGEQSFWNQWSSSPNFNWSEWNSRRSDPCHPAFYHPNYNRNAVIGRNVHISNLGLLARRTLEGDWAVVTTNLISAQPSPNTEFFVYNFQGRLLYQGRTWADGMARIPASLTAEMRSGSRLFIIAQNNLGRAYLRINDSLALTVSHFDVSGGSPTSGLRGLIYGERGVWRPGDDIFLTFLLSDPQGTLPANHPVNFELIDPRGREVISRSYSSSVDGFYPISVSTAPDAPTGDYLARVRVGGSVFSRSLKVETVMPNRLKMDLDFGDAGFIRSGTQEVSLESEWLFGAPAPGLRADISVSFRDVETSFADFPDFSFRDFSRTVSTERQNVWEGTLDQSGRAVFPMRLNPGNNVPGRVSVQFLTRVFEPSGVFSSEQISIDYSPYSRYTGIRLPRGDAARGMLLTDIDHTAEIVVVDEEGALVQGNLELSAAIYKLSWRWWWEMGSGEAADIASTLSRNPISRSSVTAVNGRASWNFRINYPDWGRYMIIVQDRNGGHAAAQIVYIDWPGWAGRPQEGGAGAMLSLTTSQNSYSTGERIEVSFPSNREAQALVSIEKGGEIIRSEWIQCQEGQTIFEFAAEPSMVPNVYVHVSLFQPHLQTQNDLPIRLYGIVPVMIQDPMTVLSPLIRAPEVWEAESTVSFTVREQNGRPMAYTVAVVDEGLLGLTRHTLPNPRSTFFAREASFLRTWDLFSEVIGAYSGRLETLLAIGGSDDIPLDSMKETQRFRPVVRFFGPFEIGPNQEKTETFDLPPYVGALRIMVLAASSSDESRAMGSQRAYGTAETSVRVTSDLMVFATLPRVLSPNDEVEVPVFVNSHVEGRRSVRVQLALEGAEVIGSSVQDINFEGAGEQMIRFRVRAPANPGAMEVRAQASSAGLKTATHVTELEVRSTEIPVTLSEYVFLNPGETWEGIINFPGREGTNSLSAEFSRLPPINLESRLDFLIRYPHGCLEQVTSGLFPQLYLDMVMDLSPERRAQIRTNVTDGIEKLYGYQVSSGGFAYWSGESIPHDWGSSYVGHFLLEARRLGYPVRDSVIQDWIHYQRDRAAVWQARNTSFSYTEQAYRLFTIALAGDPDLGAMNRLRSHMVQPGQVPLQAQWRLATAYWYAGQRDIARTMARALDLPQGNYRELSATFGSTLRDRAMILETLVLMGADRSGQGFTPEEINRTRSLFESIASALSENNWLSTKETAYALIAIAPFVQNNAGSGTLNVDYSVGGRSGTKSFNSPSSEEAFGDAAGLSSPYRFTNRSSIPVYVKLVSRGLPEEGSEPALSEGLALKVEYRTMAGQALDPAALVPGQDMEVRITVGNTHGNLVEEIALVVPVPASWEIINTRLADEGTRPTANYRYQDIRDDRVMTYFNLNRGAEVTISFMVNMTYEGRFYRPAIHAYAMYDESIRALIPGYRGE